jgi:hypothetical protein
VGEYNKLAARKIIMLQIVDNINPHAYRLKLPNHICTSDVFDVKHLVPYHGGNSDDEFVNSRANSLHLGEDDAVVHMVNSFMEHWECQL